MSVDRTLHMKSGVTAKRNVLKRDERLDILVENGQFDEQSDSVLGLRKTRVRHSKAGAKIKKEEPAGGAEAPAATGTAAAKAPAAKPGK